ncbi:MAG: hypothetical protein HKN47_26925, partial [Pirellulaceae bacterium]|nr:hypothetical protein [Pirellulaceae bacterium]
MFRSKRKRRPRLQISLRMLLAVVTVACLIFAYNQRYRQQHLTADQLAGYGAKVTYHRSLLPFLPAWASNQLRDVESVDLSRCRVDTQRIELLLRFPHLRRLYLARTNTRNEHLRIIAKLHELERLALWHTPINERGIDSLAELKNLQVLDVHGVRLSESTLYTLSQLEHLQELKFDFRKFSDRGLERFVRMPSRHRMNLNSVRVDRKKNTG